MWRIRAVLTPGYYFANRMDNKYSKMVESVKKRSNKNPAEYIWLFWCAPIMEYGLALTAGIISGILGLTLMVVGILVMFPIAGGLDLYLWEKAYGKIARNVGYRAPLLLNFDVVYWFTIGYAVGLLLPFLRELLSL